MSRFSALAACAALACAAASPSAIAQQAYPATLAGHAVLPAFTVIPAPKDAPQDLQVAGKFTTPRRVDAVGTVMGQSGGRNSGVSLPFQGQPIQGHSG
ncbi:MAG: glycerophosphodiester phosphodiesterase, partial [Acidovorax sp.]|nr:glycerophosphodiester phosphodiesterase [Acidovorax sp.]